MPSVSEVSKLSQNEIAELACTYAALILHDDDQEITGTYPITQETSSANSSIPLESKLNLTGLKFSLRPSKEKTSVPFLTLEDQVPQVTLPHRLQLKLRKLIRRKTQRRPLPLLPQKRKKKKWIWAISSVDCLSDE